MMWQCEDCGEVLALVRTVEQDTFCPHCGGLAEHMSQCAHCGSMTPDSEISEGLCGPCGRAVCAKYNEFTDSLSLGELAYLRELIRY